jgi:multidrug efflux pump subunit AcrB
VGQLVLSSPTRSNNELQDLANVYVRAHSAVCRGWCAGPFGGNARTVVIKADPDLLRQHNLTPDQLVQALDLNNQATPSGNVRIGNLNYLTPTNSTIAKSRISRISLFITTASRTYTCGMWPGWKMARISPPAMR